MENIVREIHESLSFSFEWSIPDFFSLSQKTGYCYSSPDFECGDASWCIRIYPNGSVLKHSGSIALSLRKQKSECPKHVVSFILGIKDKDGKDCKEEGGLKCEFVLNAMNWGWDTFIERSELLQERSKLVPQDVLTIFCTLILERSVGKTEQPVNEEIIQKYDNATTCGLVWTANFMAYRCRTCGISPSMSLCSDCFQGGNHEGHDFNMFRSPTGGYCDCGGNSFMRESGFCQRHGPQNQLNKPEAPPDLLSVTEVLMPRRFLRYKRIDEDIKEKDNSKEEDKKHDEKDVIHIHKGVDKVVQDLKRMFLNEQDCDVTLKVKDRDFRAHRMILVARSPVFCSMFKHDTVERSSGVVDIIDCDPQSFQDFLLYLYSGKLETMCSSNVLSLYSVADKYGVDDLKETCIEFMEKNLSADTFGDVIALAVRHNEPSLIQTTTAFFKKNVKEIIETVKWQSFLIENPIAANELHIKALK